MLSQLESIGNIEEVDKTVIKYHLKNYASDIKIFYEQEIERIVPFIGQENRGEVNGNF